MPLTNEQIQALEALVDEIRRNRAKGALYDSEILRRLRKKAVPILNQYPNKVVRAGRYYLSYNFVPPPEWGMYETLIELYDVPVDVHDNSQSRFTSYQTTYLPDYPTQPL